MATKPCVLCGADTDYVPGLGKNTISMYLSHGLDSAYVICQSCGTGRDTRAICNGIMALPEERRQLSWSHDD